MPIAVEVEAITLLSEFTKRFHLCSTSAIRSELIGIVSVGRVKSALSQDIQNVDEQIINSDALFGLWYSMLKRIHDQVEASLVAFVTGSPAAAEIIARSVLEACADLLYTLEKDSANRMSCYLLDYIKDEQKKIDQWSKVSEEMTGKEAQDHHDAIERRKFSNDGTKRFVRQMVLDMDVLENSDVGHWPTIANRFSSIGHQDTYRTVYARMCSQTHSNAEDLIRTVMASYAAFQGDRNAHEQMNLETENFSRFMMYFGIKYYLLSAASYAAHYGMSELAHATQIELDAVSLFMEELALHIGAE